MQSKNFFHRHQAFLIGICFTVVCLAGIFILGSLGWPGRLEQCAIDDTCYCEHLLFGSIIRQPVNTWSNLLATCLGLIILWRLDTIHAKQQAKIDTTSTNDSTGGKTKRRKFGNLWRKNLPDEPDNPMLTRNPLSILYGIVMIFVGTGSMYFHASGVWYGGLIDLISMQTFASFLLIYNLQRLIRFSDKWFLGISLNIKIGFTF